MCLFALGLWKLPVTEAEHTITHFIGGEVEEVDSTPGRTHLWFQVRWYLPSIYLRILYPLLNVVSFSSLHPSLSSLQTHFLPFPLLVPDEWGCFIFGESKQEGSHSICCYLCSPNAKGRGGALFSLPLSPASLSFHWSSSLPLGLAHPSSLSIPVSDAVIQSDAVIREGGFTETHTLCISGRAGGLEV